MQQKYVHTRIMLEIAFLLINLISNAVIPSEAYT